MKWFVIYFRYRRPNESKPGPVSHFKIQADDLAQARELAKRYANYPGIEVLSVEEVPGQVPR